MKKKIFLYIFIFSFFAYFQCVQKEKAVPAKQSFIEIPADSVISKETAQKWLNCNKELDQLGIKYASLTAQTDSAEPDIKKIEQEYSFKQKSICNKYGFKDYVQFKKTGMLLLTKKNISTAQALGIAGFTEKSKDSSEIESSENIKH